MSDGPIMVPITSIQPSQPYIDAARLEGVLSWFDADGSLPDPVPVVHDASLPHDGSRPMLTDGHTRVFAAHLAGHERVPVIEDADWPEMDHETYQISVTWCLEEGISEIGDLVGRVVSSEVFRQSWIDRCEAVGRD